MIDPVVNLLSGLLLLSYALLCFVFVLMEAIRKWRS